MLALRGKQQTLRIALKEPTLDRSYAKDVKGHCERNNLHKRINTHL